MSNLATGNSGGRGAGAGFGAHPSVRLPLQVGSTAHWSFARAIVPSLIGGLITAAVVGILLDDGFEELAVVAFMGAIGLGFLAYAFVQLRQAIVLRPSDILFDGRGFRLEGGSKHGMSVGWEELSPPYASIDTEPSTRLSIRGALTYLVTASLKGSATQKFDIHELSIHRGDRKQLLARSEVDSESASLVAAAETIAAIEEGRRYVDQAPAAVSEGLFCPSCGAAVPIADASEVPCGHCGAAVPVASSLRERVAAASRLASQSKDRSKLVRRLLRQPAAPRTNIRLLGYWMCMVASIPAAVVLYVLYEHFYLPEIAFGLRPWWLWLVPPVVMISAAVLGRATLVNRRAMQMLTLGFGALAPERDGEPPRCRRCHGPLPDAGPGGLVSCGYCQTENVTGIDLRPMVGSARAEEASLERTLRQRTRARLIWGSGAILAGAALASSALVWGLSAALLRPVDIDIVRPMSRGEDVAELRVDDVHIEYSGKRARIAATIINPNPGPVFSLPFELKLYDESDELLHSAEIDWLSFQPRGASMNWDLPPALPLPVILEERVGARPARVELDRSTSPPRWTSGALVEIPIDEVKLDAPKLFARGRNDTPWPLDSGILVVALHDPAGHLAYADYVAVEAAPHEAWEVVVDLPAGPWTRDQLEVYGWFWLP